MSNKYFDSANNPNRAVPYEVARAEQINNTDDLIEQGLNLVEADIIRAIKLPEGTAADQVITATPSQRQNNLLGFDAAGNATVVGGDVAARQGKVIAWDADGNVLLRDYANDITAPANQVAQDKIDVVQLKVDTQAIKDSAVSETTAIRDTALVHRNEALQFRNEAEVFKNQAGALAAGEIIDDSITAVDMTWSSSKTLTELESKQEVLVSGFNIKTINGSSVLGVGDIVATPTDYKTIQYLSYVSI